MAGLKCRQVECQAQKKRKKKNKIEQGAGEYFVGTLLSHGTLSCLALYPIVWAQRAVAYFSWGGGAVLLVLLCKLYLVVGGS